MSNSHHKFTSYTYADIERFVDSLDVHAVGKILINELMTNRKTHQDDVEVAKLNAFDKIQKYKSLLRECDEAALQKIKSQMITLISQPELQYLRERKNEPGPHNTKVYLELLTVLDDAIQYIQNKTTNKKNNQDRFNNYFDRMELHDNVKKIMRTLVSIGQETSLNMIETTKKIGELELQIQKCSVFQLQQLYTQLNQRFSLSEERDVRALGRLLGYLDQEHFFEQTTAFTKTTYTGFSIINGWIQHAPEQKRIDQFISDLGVHEVGQHAIRSLILIGLDDQKSVDEKQQLAIQCIQYYAAYFRTVCFQEKSSDFLEKIKTTILKLSQVTETVPMFSLNYLSTKIDNANSATIDQNALFFQELDKVFRYVKEEYHFDDNLGFVMVEWSEENSLTHSQPKKERKPQQSVHVHELNVYVALDVLQSDEAQFFFLTIPSNYTIKQVKEALQKQAGVLDFDTLSFTLSFYNLVTNQSYTASFENNKLKESDSIEEWLQDASNFFGRFELKNNVLKIDLKPKALTAKTEPTVTTTTTTTTTATTTTTTTAMAMTTTLSELATGAPSISGMFSHTQSPLELSWDHLPALSQLYFLESTKQSRAEKKEDEKTHWKSLPEGEKKEFVVKFQDYYKMRNAIIKELVDIGLSDQTIKYRKKAAYKLIEQWLDKLDHTNELDLDLIAIRRIRTELSELSPDDNELEKSRKTGQYGLLSYLCVRLYPNGEIRDFSHKHSHRYKRTMNKLSKLQGYSDSFFNSRPHTPEVSRVAREDQDVDSHSLPEFPRG